MTDPNVLALLTKLDEQIAALRAEHAGVDPSFDKQQTAAILHISVRKLEHARAKGQIDHYSVGGRKFHGASHIRAYQQSIDSARKRTKR